LMICSIGSATLAPFTSLEPGALCSELPRNTNAYARQIQDRVVGSKSWSRMFLLIVATSRTT
jgi:hypothetical protein